MQRTNEQRAWLSSYTSAQRSLSLSSIYLSYTCWRIQSATKGFTNLFSLLFQFIPTAVFVFVLFLFYFFGCCFSAVFVFAACFFFCSLNHFNVQCKSCASEILAGLDGWRLCMSRTSLKWKKKRIYEYTSSVVYCYLYCGSRIFVLLYMDISCS